MKATTGYSVMTANGSFVCTNGQVYKPMFVGPGGYNAKIWKTKAGALRYARQIRGFACPMEGSAVARG